MSESNGFIPTYCCIALLEGCFLRCRMCYKWQTDIQTRDPEEPTINQWKSFISALRDIVPDGFQINFAGGEPLGRRETVPLIGQVSSLGMRAHLASNGHMIDDNMARELGRAGLASLCLSVDGVRPTTHDFLRGTPGAHRQVLHAMTLMKRYAPRTRIIVSGVICSYNLDELEEIVRWADRNQLVDSIIFQVITQPFSTPEDEYWYTKKEFADLWPQSVPKAHAALDRLIALKQRPERTKLDISIVQLKVFKRYFSDPHDFLKTSRCHIDDKVLNVTPTGNVHICYYKEPIGNIKGDTVRAMICSPRYVRVREMVNACRKNCQSIVNCNFSEEESYCVDQEESV